MNLPPARRPCRHDFLKTDKNSKENVKSTLSICQEATLLARNRSIQSHGRTENTAAIDTANLAGQIQAIESQIGHLPSSIVDKIKRIKRLQHILNQLEESLASEGFNGTVS